MNGGKSLKELQERWRNARFADDGELNARSFRRYRTDIANILKLEISYNSAARIYELEDVEAIKKNELYSYFLSSFYAQNLSLLSEKHRDKIQMPDPPVGAEFISTILEAFDGKWKIAVEKDDSTKYIAIPCRVKEWDHRWYLVLINEYGGRMLSLSSIKNLTLTDTHYTDADCEGLDLEDNIPLDDEQIIVRFSTSCIEYIRKTPLHCSQEELTNGLFNYNVPLEKTFLQKILAYGTNVEILYPQRARKEMRLLLDEINRKYE